MAAVLRMERDGMMMRAEAGRRDEAEKKAEGRGRKRIKEGSVGAYTGLKKS